MIDLAPEKPRSFIAILTLVTLFQYAEKLTDQDAIEAVRTRPDWKYALHLPLSYPGFEADWLCQMRRYALETTIGMAVIQAVADRLACIGYFDRTPLASEVVTSICQRNRMTRLAKSMLLAVEALAVCKPAWVVNLPLSSLYEKYARTLRTLSDVETEEAFLQLASTTGAEIDELLRSVEASGIDELIELEELLILREVWGEQYDHMNKTEQNDHWWIWRQVDCQCCV